MNFWLISKLNYYFFLIFYLFCEFLIFDFVIFLQTVRAFFEYIAPRFLVAFEIELLSLIIHYFLLSLAWMGLKLNL